MEAVTSVKIFKYDIPTAVIFYDLIPWIYKDKYLEHPQAEAWYSRKIEHLNRCDLVLSISASAGNEAVDFANVPLENVDRVALLSVRHRGGGGVSVGCFGE
jgi:hypothetical protein